MGDIEAMFYQVRILEYHQMCVHLFGGASSPSCWNYALKRSAIDNEVQFDPEAAKTLMKNFYVDDLLKSTPRFANLLLALPKQ